jgi:hypothetical protein
MGVFQRIGAWFRPYERYTVSFSDTALEVLASLGVTDVTEFLRKAPAVRVDLHDLENRGLTILFRDDATGQEWLYDPATGKTTPIDPDDNGGGQPSAALRPSFEKGQSPVYTAIYDKKLAA